MNCNCRQKIDVNNLVKPRSMVDEARAKELVAGIIRLTREEQEIPEEWIAEYAEIVSRYPALNVPDPEETSVDPDPNDGNGG